MQKRELADRARSGDVELRFNQSSGEFHFRFLGVELAGLIRDKGMKAVARRLASCSISERCQRSGEVFDHWFSIRNGQVTVGRDEVVALNSMHIDLLHMFTQMISEGLKGQRKLDVGFQFSTR